MVRDTSNTLTPGAARLMANLAGRTPGDVATIADDSALGIARSNVIESERRMAGDIGRCAEARRVYLAAARQLQNRADRHEQRIAELHAIEAEVGLPLTDVSGFLRDGPAPVTADEYAMPVEGV